MATTCSSVDSSDQQLWEFTRFVPDSVAAGGASIGGYYKCDVSRFFCDPKNVERVKDMYLKSISFISLVTFPLTLGLLVVSQSFVLALFGDKWAEIIPILQVFCLLGLIQSIGTTVGWIYQSQGRTDIMFRWGLVSGSIFHHFVYSGFAVGRIRRSGSLHRG
jgi:hypothetical protein